MDRVFRRTRTPALLFAVFAPALAGALAGGCALVDKRPTGVGAGGPAASTFVFVGTGAGSIEVLSLDSSSGSLLLRNKVSTGGVLSGLAGRPFEGTLVALDEKAAAVATFTIDAKGATLRPTSRGSTGGSHPSRVTMDRSGKFILVTNRANASVGVLSIGAQGQLSAPELFPAGAGAFGLALHPSNALLFVANNKAGTVSQLAFNASTGALTPKAGSAVGLPAGSGPRHIACHPGGRWVYVLNEANNTVSVHAFDDLMGTITPLSFQIVSTLSTSAGSPSAKSARATDMVIAPNGRFVYVLNRGDDSVVTLAVDSESGGLSLTNRTPSGGDGANGLAIDPSGGFLFATHAGDRKMATFRLEAATGAPTLTDTIRLDQPPLAVVALRAPAP